MKTAPILNAKIGGTNFSGLDLTGYNVRKTRSFILYIDDPELLERWKNIGIKIYEDEKGKPITVVTVPERCWVKTKFRGEDPEILDQSMYQVLDICEISRAELIINEYHWSERGRSGVKLYLANGTFTINKQVNASDVFAYYKRRLNGISNDKASKIEEDNNG